jgi:hypothetical protein
MKTFDDFRAQREADKIIKKYKERSLEFCKNNIHDLAGILNQYDISPYDCTNEMRRKLSGKYSAKTLKVVLSVNDQLIHWTKVLNIIKKQPSVG